VILYEHPFNERVRTYLRLEHLFQRFEELTSRNHAVDNHFALTTLFELVEAGGRTDLKTDVLKDLERHKQQFNSLRGNPSVSETALQQLLDNIATADSTVQWEKLVKTSPKTNGSPPCATVQPFRVALAALTCLPTMRGSNKAQIYVAQISCVGLKCSNR
jgi:hypothetical protein